VTLDLPAGAPALELPWIITFGPLSEDEEWEPVVVGPYERPHALALAEEIVADEDLMAVVEPLLPHVSVAEIRAEIAAAIALGGEEEDADEETDLVFDEDEDLDGPEFDGPEFDGADLDGADLDGAEFGGAEFGGAEFGGAESAGQDGDEDWAADGADPEDEAGERPEPPTPEEIRAGFARIAERLTKATPWSGGVLGD
jgi:Pentapeptide repeats (9 copies)